METRDVYLDYAAATPVDPQVLQAMLPYFGECFYNPSAPYAHAAEARRAVEDARTTIAHLMGARPANVTFTAGATEANNLAFATAREGHVVTCSIEHDSVRTCALGRGGAVVGVGSDGLVDPADIARAITPSTRLVSVSLANGEIGCIQPLRDIGAVVQAERARRLEERNGVPIWLHTDATQAATTHALNVSSLGADLVTVSAAKMYGPKQVGLLWAADGVELRPLVVGGGQERGLRSGTENVPGVVGFAKAFELAAQARKQEARRLARLRDELQGAILQRVPWAVVAGPRRNADRLPGLLHVSFPGLEARRLVIMLEQRGVSVGTGSACAASKMRVSHVLGAIGLDAATAAGSIRITLGRPTVQDDVSYAAEAISDAVEREAVRTQGRDVQGGRDGR